MAAPTRVCRRRLRRSCSPRCRRHRLLRPLPARRRLHPHQPALLRNSRSALRRTMAMSSKILLLAGAALVLAGCNTVHKNIGMEDPGMGEAVKYDAAIQTINPEPVYT